MAATSGTPLPALTAFCSAVYSSVAVPALTRFTWTLGYLASKSVTTFFSVGSQDQTVMSPPVVRAVWRSASETVGEAAVSVPEEPQAVAASVTASAVAPSMRLRRDIVMGVPFRRSVSGRDGQSGRAPVNLSRFRRSGPTASTAGAAGTPRSAGRWGAVIR